MGLLSFLKRALSGSVDDGEVIADESMQRVQVQRKAPSTPSSPPDSGTSRYLNEAEALALLVPDEKGRLPVVIKDGFFVHVPTGRMIGVAARAMTKQGIVSFKVRGTNYRDGAKVADTRPGRRAVLKREPENEYDPNAIGVWGDDAKGNLVMVGYVNKGNARSLAKKLDAGENITAEFMRGERPGREAGLPAVVLINDAYRAMLG